MIRIFLLSALLALALFLAPGPVEITTDGQAVPYCAWNPDDPESLAGAAACSAYVVVRCIEGSIAGEGCPW